MALEQAAGYRFGRWGGASATRRERIARSLPANVSYAAWYRQVAANWTPAGARPALDRSLAGRHDPRRAVPGARSAA
jgi:hypothetical protein